MVDRRRSKQLKKLHHLAELKSRKGMQAVQYLQQKLQQEKDNMAQLQQCKLEYVTEDSNAGNASLPSQSAALLKNGNRFLAKLDQAMLQQQMQIRVVSNQLEQVNTHWRELDSKTQSMQRLSESAVNAELAAESAEEQKEADRFATQANSAGSRRGILGQS